MSAVLVIRISSTPLLPSFAPNVAQRCSLADAPDGERFRGDGQHGHEQIVTRQQVQCIEKEEHRKSRTILAKAGFSLGPPS
jgi:hypothetical protein